MRVTLRPSDVHTYTAALLWLPPSVQKIRSANRSSTKAFVKLAAGGGEPQLLTSQSCADNNAVLMTLRYVGGCSGCSHASHPLLVKADHVAVLSKAVSHQQ